MSTVSKPTWVDPERWPYPVQAHVDSDGAMAFVDVGPRDGPVVLMAHGTPTWSIEWAAVIDGLKDTARCIAIDHLGFGLSERPDVGYAPEDHAQRFARFADHLDLHDVTLVVHDFGGPIALPWAVANPDRVRRIVIVNTFGWPLDDEPHIARPARMLGSGFGRWLYGAFNLSIEFVASTAWKDRAHWRALVDQIRPVFPDPKSRKQVLWALAKSLLASTDHYAALEQGLRQLEPRPAFSVVWGTDDPAFPVSFRDRWLALLPGAERVDVSAGHWPHVEEPSAVVEHLRRVLA
ncbi:MAG: alpha/beta fold hydrolase [Myxococcota bacterium]